MKTYNTNFFPFQLPFVQDQMMDLFGFGKLMMVRLKSVDFSLYALKRVALDLMLLHMLLIASFLTVYMST